MEKGDLKANTLLHCFIERFTLILLRARDTRNLHFFTSLLQ